MLWPLKIFHFASQASQRGVARISSTIGAIFEATAAAAAVAVVSNVFRIL